MDLPNQQFLLLKLAETLGVVAVILIAGTSGRLTFRPVNFKYPEREGQVSIGLFIVLLALSLFYYLSGWQFNVPFEGALKPFARQAALAIFSLGITALALFYRRQPLLSAGWGARKNFNIGLRMGLMLVFLTIFLRGRIMAIINGVTTEQGIALALIFITVIAEESIFRGYLQLRLTSRFGKPTGWLITSGAFVIWQIPRLMLDMPNLWINLLLVIVQSILLGWLMQKSGHIMAPALYRAISEWLTIL